MMDRKIPEDVRKKIRKKKYIQIFCSAVLLAGVIGVLASVLGPSVSGDSIDVSTVVRGPLEISLGAVGSVVPFYEEIISSPISTKIVNVYRKSGERVHKGDTILQLDLSSAHVEFQTDLDDIAIKKCKMDQYRTSAESQIKELEMQILIEEKKLRRSEVQLVNEHHLDSIGASTKDKVKQMELEYEVASLQLEQLKLKLENLHNTSASDLKVYELEYKIAKDRFSIRQKTIGEAQIVAPRDATLSWVNDQIGTSVSEGEQLAILSDLSHYKVEADIADSYAGKFSAGNRAEIRMGSSVFTGSVSNIVPSVTDGRILFTVLIDDSENEAFRPGLRVDVNVINAVKEDVLKINNRAYYSGPGTYDLWVISGNVAEKKQVRLGESSHSEVEVISGLNEGDRVIVSNMNRYRDRRLKVK